MCKAVATSIRRAGMMGIPAAFVNYNLTGSQTRQSETQSRSSYLNLRNGANLGPWRLRNIVIHAV